MMRGVKARRTMRGLRAPSPSPGPRDALALRGP
jgi:hypothetical protein